ncbi:MAG: hypothetical protein LBL76_01805 [Treponema sp.]|nr:hypothetical protein [Treponema sp.]
MTNKQAVWGESPQIVKRGCSIHVTHPTRIPGLLKGLIFYEPIPTLSYARYKHGL